MDLEEQQKLVIAEQRTQLMQLREQVKRLKQSLGSDPKDVAQLFELHGPRPTEGKTVGLRISSMMRDRLNAVSLRLNADSYRQTVMVCVELGLRQLEGVEDARPVATVRQVLGSHDNGHGGDLPAHESAGVPRGTGLLADN